MRRLLNEYSSILLAAISATALLAIFSGGLGVWFENIYPEVKRLTIPTVYGEESYEPVLCVDNIIEMPVLLAEDYDTEADLQAAIDDNLYLLTSLYYVKAWESSDACYAYLEGAEYKGPDENDKLEIYMSGIENIDFTEQGIYQLVYVAKNTESNYSFYKRVSILIF